MNEKEMVIEEGIGKSMSKIKEKMKKKMVKVEGKKMIEW